MVGAGKGVIRSMLVDGQYTSEVIPVDFAINSIITIAHATATAKEKSDQIPVYNLTCDESKRVTWKEIMDLGKKINYEYPLEPGLWYPDGNITTNYYYHMFNVIMFMWLPAYLVDFLLLIAGQKRFMIRVQNKIATGLEVLQFFTTRKWDFKSPKYQSIYTNLTQKDKEIFNMDSTLVDTEEYMKIGILGGRQYLMKESPSTLPKSRIYLRIQYAVDRLFKTLFIGYILYWIIGKLGSILVEAGSNI